MLGVDVDRGRHLSGPQEQRPEPRARLLEALPAGQRAEPGGEGRGLDRDVDPGHRPPGVALEDGFGGPGGRRPGQPLEDLADPLGVAVGFGRGQGLLTEQVDGPRLPGPPQLLQPRQGLGGRLPGDELAGHAVDVAPGGGGRQAGPERDLAADAEAQPQGGGRGAPVEVLPEVAHDVVVVTAAGEDVDEAEQLGLERPFGHGPAEELLAPPRPPEQAGLLLAAGLGDPPGQRLDISLGGCAHGPHEATPASRFCRRTFSANRDGPPAF